MRIQSHTTPAIRSMLMASSFFCQSGVPNTSLHLPLDYHQVAPFPNMNPSSVMPAKRGPEDDVQFVAANPVKKCRDSREQPPILTQHTASLASSHPQKPAPPVAQAAPNQQDTSSLGICSDPPLGRFTCGNSLSNLNNFAFPPPDSGVRSQTSQSSPLLSPRELPASIIPDNTHASSGTPATGSMTAASIYGPVPQKEMAMPWHMSGFPPNLVLLDNSVGSTRPADLTPFELPNGEQYPAVGDQEKPSKSPNMTKGTESSCVQHDEIGCQQQKTLHIHGPAAVDVIPEAEPQRPKRPRDASQQTEQPLAHGGMPCVSTSGAQSGFRPSVPTTKEAISEVHPQETLEDGHATLSNPQPPCLACEQTRQQNMFNQGNGYLTGHQPQPHLQYPWHGPNVTQQQMPMGHQFPASIIGGFNMAANGSQNIQPRAHPISTGHVPLSYILPSQVPSQMPMTLARPFNTAGIPGPESWQGGLPQNLPQNRGQQVSSGQVPPLSSTLPQQMTQPQYVQSQLHSFQQPVVVPRTFITPSLVTPTHAPVAPPQASPTTSSVRAPTSPEPREHSPNLIVDIAETCEDLFPWEEVAQRHNVPRQKVVETFSAVVQLPLLRCTTDKRRHGNLATSRLRQYTKAKRDVEAAEASTSSPPLSSTAMPAAPNQTQGHRDRAVLPVVWDMANTMAPLGLPSSIANGLAGAWQR